MIQETRTDRSKSVYIYTDESGYEPLARVETTTGTEQKVLYYHTDVNGAPEELTDEEGHIVWSCSYQLWGKPIQEIEHTDIQQNLRYQGQYLDRETGLHYNTFRYYDPDIGRFTQPDPIGLLGGFNLYQYAPNSLMWIDPWGWSCRTDAKKLRTNMKKAHVPVPNYNYSAHHIVMSNSQDVRMKKLRDKMKVLKVGKNSFENGAYLPTSSKDKAKAQTKAIAHSKVHTEIYMENVYNRLININVTNEFTNELKKIGKELLNGTFKY
ncbi:RHS domain-containing protein [Gilliamella sp. B3781]|uniref:RHS repeat-associated core domain-containing protein n=1 Tax=Gilliamella sp. B3780 TaxID=2818024 RepID=UPI002269B211|nr:MULTISPECIES: RHS repeat-associated core domain-containing protein [unclassified Gilliamella]MCX8642520.1 RHS domain-containing protein [Gilliamella sp. B3835]MCX8706374.1 RHS domain-containing protein [Gilliamella sp. B3783]MCX8709402.1 RHS domain-containing protein [Gilliamella sp. B3780]MCX8714425.1 RHS domain-containing protein [Gilliamella sp. B3781]MCX8717106.1 RHS domain-containing protein [Gilliamella sp. B3784]